MTCRFCGDETAGSCCINCARRQVGSVTPSSVNFVKEDAGFWLRFVAWIIDTSIINCIVLLIAYLGLYILGFNFVVVLGTFLQEILQSIFGGGKSILFAILFSFVLSMLAWFFVITIGFFVFGYFYALLFETSKFQATPGKILLGLEVVNADDQKISKRMSTIRHIGKLLFIPTLSISFLLTAFTTRKQAMHDMISKCYVIKGDKYSFERAIIASAVAIILLIAFIASTTTVKFSSKSRFKNNKYTTHYTLDPQTGEFIKSN